MNPGSFRGCCLELQSLGQLQKFRTCRHMHMYISFIHIKLFYGKFQSSCNLLLSQSACLQWLPIPLSYDCLLVCKLVPHKPTAMCHGQSCVLCTSSGLALVNVREMDSARSAHCTWAQSRQLQPHVEAIQSICNFVFSSRNVSLKSLMR